MSYGSDKYIYTKDGTLSNSIVRIDSGIASLDVSVIDLKNTSDSTTLTIEGINQKVAENTESSVLLNEDVARIDSNIVIIDSSISSINTDISRIDTEIVNINEDVLRIDNKIVTLDEDIVRIDAHSAVIDSDVSSINNEIARIDSVIDNPLFFVGMQMMWKGTASTVPAGWIIVNEAMGRAIFCASNDAQVGTTTEQSTAMPTNKFVLNNTTHTHSLPAFTVSGTTGGSSQGDRNFPTFDGNTNWGLYEVSSSGTGRYVAGRSTSTSLSTVSTAHTHSFSKTVAARTSGNNSTTPTLSGGDSETRPKAYLTYLIEYVGL